MNPYMLPLTTFAPWLQGLQYGQAPQNPYLQGLMNRQPPQVNLRGQRMKAPRQEQSSAPDIQVPRSASYDPNAEATNMLGMKMKQGTMDYMSDLGAGIGQAFDNPVVQALSYADRARRARIAGDPAARQQEFENQLNLRKQDFEENKAAAESDKWQVGEKYDDQGKTVKGIFKASDPIGTWQNLGGAKADTGAPVKIMKDGKPIWSAPDAAIGQQAFVEPPSSTTVNVGSEKAFNKKYGENQADIYKAMQEDAGRAPVNIGRYDRMESLLNAGVLSGKVRDQTLGVRQALNDLGLTDDAQVPGQEQIRAMAGAMTMETASQLKGPSSDKDVIFALSQNPNLSNSPEGNKELIRAGRKIEQRKVQIAKQAAQYLKAHGELDADWDTYINDWAAQNPIFDDADRKRIESLTQPQGQGGFRYLGTEK